MTRLIIKTGLLLSAAFSLSICEEIASLSALTDTAVQKNIQFRYDAKIVKSESVSSIDLGQKGNIGISDISIPEGPFSIESRFFLRDYNNSDPMISDIAAAFDCDYNGTGNTEGFDFRIGGGYIYPLKFVDLYDSISDWVHPDYEQKTVRSIISQSVGEFGLGTNNITWREVYTNQCIKRNIWNHMVAVWNGESMQIYLNGYNATDPFRVQGKELKPFIRNISNVTIGAENSSSGRHFNGEIDFVKIYNTALSPDSIYKRYREKIGNTHCRKFIIIESPRYGEVITPKTKIKYTVDKDFDCDTNNNPAAYCIQICHDQSFADTPSFRNYKLTSNELTFGDIIGNDSTVFNGLFFIKITGTNDNILKKSKASEDNILAESGIIPTYAVNANTSTLPSGIKQMQSNRIVKNYIFDCRGRRISSSQGVNVKSLKNGIYLEKSDNKIKKHILFQ